MPRCGCCGCDVGNTTRAGLCWGCDLAGCNADTWGVDTGKGVPAVPERCNCRQCQGRDRFLNTAIHRIEEAQDSESEADADTAASDAVAHLEAFLAEGDA